MVAGMIAVRACTESDFPAIQAIYAIEVLEGTASFETEPPNPDDIRARHASLVEDGFPWLVATIDERVAGYAYASPYRARPAYRFTVENSVYVARWARRKGIGKRLLEQLLGQLRQGEWHSVVAVIGDSANEASISLHRWAGFEDVGVLRDVGYKHGRWLDTVLLQLAL